MSKSDLERNLIKLINKQEIKIDRAKAVLNMIMRRLKEYHNQPYESREDYISQIIWDAEEEHEDDWDE